MKILIVFYSRTGTTKKVAQEIARQLNADIEEIIDTKKRGGPLNYLSAGRDGMKRRLTKINSLKKSIFMYDKIIVGTPVWAWNISPAIRTFLTDNKNKIKKVAFFCTMGGSDPQKVFDEMEKVCNKKPVSTLGLKTKEVVSDNFESKLNDFIKRLK